MSLYLTSIITQGIYTGIISTISNATIKTCNIMQTIYSHENPDIKKVMKELDIERKLKTLESIFNIQIPNNTLNEKINLQKDPISLCLLYIIDAIKKIQNDLLLINKKVNSHNLKWFSTWRSLNIKNLLDNLELDCKLLDNRFDDLIKISNLLKN